MKYKEWILPPALRDFHEGRIWLRNHAPFHETDIKRGIERNYFQINEGIQTSPYLKCNRCHNVAVNQFTHFDCAKCQKTCVYCRHCLNMGRISGCTKLLVWRGPQACKQKRHQFEWAGQFTPLQQQAANEMLESVKRQRNHLVHAVCGASGMTNRLAKRPLRDLSLIIPKTYSFFFLLKV